MTNYQFLTIFFAYEASGIQEQDDESILDRNLEGNKKLAAFGNFQLATAFISELAKRTDVTFQYTGHAKQRMMLRQVDRADVRRVLETGEVFRVDDLKDTTYRVAGADLDDRDLQVVVVPRHNKLIIKVVTVIRPGLDDMESDENGYAKTPQQRSGT